MAGRSHGYSRTRELLEAYSPDERLHAQKRADTWFASLDPDGRPDDYVNTPVCSLGTARRFMQRLNRQRSIRGILRLLLALGKPRGLRRIRYYRYLADTRKLVSVESAGHNHRRQVLLRMGGIYKFRDSAALDKHDSYWCFELGKPVIFQLVGGAPAALEPKTGPGGLPLIEVSADQCENVLGRKHGSTWVDFPLKGGRGESGKFSCDLDDVPLSEAVAADLLLFWPMAQAAATYIELLNNQEIQVLESQVAGVGEETQRIIRSADLFEYCVGTLAKRFRCKYASILTISRDSLGSEKLVLRKTSFPGSQAKENVVFYQVSPQPDTGLTTWVSLQKRSLRFHNLDQESLCRQQLDTYRPRPVWKNLIPDSNSHTSFLAVPLAGVGDHAAGVLRFTEKNDGEPTAYFTEAEQRMLEALARDVIAPKLAGLADTEVSHCLQDDAWLMAIIALQRAYVAAMQNESDQHRAGVALAEAMSAAFTEGTGAERLFLLNLMGKDQMFRHGAIAGELRDQLRGREQNVYTLEDTLTGHVLRNPKKIFFVNDFARAKSKQMLFPILDDTKDAPAYSALAYPFEFDPRHRGALVVASRRQDLRPETHGRLVECMVNGVGQLIASKCVNESRRG